VVLSSLALLAESRGDLDQAESLHRQSLTMAIAVEDQVGIADSLKALGRFLLQHDRNREEGCNMLEQAIVLYHQMNLPDEQKTRALARDLGCEE
jgi:hypothetical protein